MKYFSWKKAAWMPELVRHDEISALPPLVVAR
jgi:hypothetical protein